MFLLDTCALLWLAADHTRLSDEVISGLIRHSDAIFVSAISAFEVGTKHAKGKLELPTAQLADLVILTPDSLIGAYPETRTLW